jgi:hypothetical protein
MELGTISSTLAAMPATRQAEPVVRQERQEAPLAVMDAETMKNFFFMIAGMPVEEQSDNTRWA